MATTYGKEYKDFDLDFGAHPSHGDIEVLNKSSAIKRSMKNILKMNANERLFQPEIDGGLGPLLFENFSALTTSRLKRAVENAMKRFEPRAEVVDVKVNPDEDQNAYYVRITFVPDNKVQEEDLEVYLERTR